MRRNDCNYKRLDRFENSSFVFSHSIRMVAQKLDEKMRRILVLAFVFIAISSIESSGYNGRKKFGRYCFPRGTPNPGVSSLEYQEAEDDVDDRTDAEVEAANQSYDPIKDHPEEANPIWPEFPIHRIKCKQAAKCFKVLWRQYPQICEVIFELKKIRPLLPNSDYVSRRRMGGRRYDFGVWVSRGKDAMGQLASTIKAVGNKLKKKLGFGSTTNSTESSQQAVNGTLQLKLFLKSTENPENISHDQLPESKNLDGRDPEKSRRFAGFGNGRRSNDYPKKCFDFVSRSRMDVCRVLCGLRRIDKLLRVSSMGPRSLTPSSENGPVLTKLNYNDLYIDHILRAIAKALADGKNFKITINTNATIFWMLGTNIPIIALHENYHSRKLSPWNAVFRYRGKNLFHPFFFQECANSGHFNCRKNETFNIKSVLEIMKNKETCI